MHSAFIQGRRGETLRFTAASILIDHRLLQMLASFNNNPVLVINDAFSFMFIRTGLVFDPTMVVSNYKL